MAHPDRRPCHAGYRLYPSQLAHDYARQQRRPTDLGEERLPDWHFPFITDYSPAWCVWMGGDTAVRKLVRGGNYLYFDCRFNVADPASANPQPAPCALGAPGEYLLARLGLSGIVEYLPAVGTGEQRDFQCAGRRKRGHVDVTRPGAVRFLFCAKESLNHGTHICLDRGCPDGDHLGRIVVCP